MFDKTNEPDPTGGSPSGVSAKTQEQPIDNPVSSQTQQRWRDVIKVHPAADLFPMMDPDELKSLGEDIEKNGLQNQPVLWCKGKRPNSIYDVKEEELFLLDGRNRLDALEAIGLKIHTHSGGRSLRVYKPIIRDGEEDQETLFTTGSKVIFEKEGKHSPDCDPYAYVISANIHRRHLTAAQKGELIAALLKANPNRSDRATAKIAKVDNKTVAARRKELEEREEIPHVDIRADTKGRSQPATKPAQSKAPSGPAQSAAMASTDPKVVMQTAPESSAEAAYVDQPIRPEDASPGLDQLKKYFLGLSRPDRDQFLEWANGQTEPKTESEPVDEPAAPVVENTAATAVEFAQTEHPEPQPETPPDARDGLSPDTRDALRKFEEHAAFVKPGPPWLGPTQCEQKGISDDAIDALLAAGLIVASPGNSNAYGIPGW